ncbi:MAG: formylglycine-generating enzyme family protein, partial [Bacteroidaceae bacterium]
DSDTVIKEIKPKEKEVKQPEKPKEKKKEIKSENRKPSERSYFGFISLTVGLLVIAGILITNVISKNTEAANDIVEDSVAVEDSATVDVSERVVGKDKVFTVGEVEFTMKYVKGGTFRMGATSEQQNPGYDEEPVHRVTLSSFYIGETEVTQALWTAVMGSNPSHFKGDYNPVENVYRNDCQEFITKLNNLTGKKFHLPTEAEWEYAARGGNKSKGYQYSGSNNIDDVAWYWKNSGDSYLSGTDDDCDASKIIKNNSKTHPVKTKQPNELGIYDMSGNVREWCQDWKGDYSSSSQTTPTGASSGSLRVTRGGGWDDFARYCRSAFRGNIFPDARDYNLGLRLCLSE